MRKQQTEEVGAGLKRFAMLMVILLVIIVGVIIGERLSRLSQDALALAAGLGLGCLVGLVPVGCLLLVARIALRYWESRELRRTSPPQQPPVIIIPTGYLPPQPAPWDAGTGTQLVQSAGPRSFTVIGDE
jgi:hypothetical protein